MSTEQQHKNKTPSSPWSPPPLDQAILKERLKMREGSSLTAARGTLSKCAVLYGKYSHVILTANSKEEGGAGDAAEAVEDAKMMLEMELKLHSVEMQKMFQMLQGTETTNDDSDEKDIVAMDAEIERMNKEVHELQQEFINASKSQGQMQEYEQLAKLALHKPSRRDTQQHLELLNKQTKEVERQHQEHQEQLQARRAQCQLLLQSIQDLSQSLVVTATGDEQEEGSASALLMEEEEEKHSAVTSAKTIRTTNSHEEGEEEDEEGHIMDTGL